MRQRTDYVWKSEKLTRQFLSGVRGAIPLAETQIAVMLQLLGAGRPIRKFLDLGCGDGVLGAAILARHPKATGVFVDFSEPMLAACRTKLLGKKATTLPLDYGRPVWVDVVRPRGPFDAIVSGFSIHHQTDRRKRALYREIYRLLAPGGWFVNIEHVAPACPTTNELFEAAMVDSIQQQLHPKLSRAAVRRKFVRRQDKAANILAPVETQCRWLHTAGFVEVDCYFKFHELAVFGGRQPLTSQT